VLMETIKILFVCLGNICRSPLAEAIARKQLHEKGLSRKVEVASAGTGNYHVGEGADPRALACAQQNALPMDHRARQLKQAHQQEFDYILTMDEDNLANTRSLFGQELEEGAQLFLMQQFSAGAQPLAVEELAPQERSIPDPYWGGEEGFQQVHDMLQLSIAHFIQYLKQQHSL
jgi:protein-tyrosine phosphatase